MSKHRKIGRGDVRALRDAHAFARSVDGVRIRRRPRPRTKRQKSNIEVSL